MTQPTRVLLVEDDPLTLASTADALTDAGCTVHPASTYDEALSFLDASPGPAVLVTDIVLNGDESGLRLVQEAHVRRPDMGLIVLSGAVRPDLPAMPTRALFCTKPCAPGALVQLVQSSMDW